MSDPQPRSSGAWEVLARAAAGADREAEAPVERCELIRLSLAGDAYALPIEAVREIVRLRPITPIPRAPAAVHGVIALRGEMLQVVDARRRLGLRADAPGRPARLVVVRSVEGGAAVLLVDAVQDVLRVPVDALRPAPGGEAEPVSALVEHAGRFVSVLDAERMLDLGR